MSESAWNSQLQSEGVSHSLPNDYLQTVRASTFNYGAELELPRIDHVVQKYITDVLDVVKMTLYKHLKVAVPASVRSPNKITVLGQYSSKLEKVRSCFVYFISVTIYTVVVGVAQW